VFPGAHSQVYYNEAGEPLGWDEPSEPDYCVDCGVCHVGECYIDYGEEVEEAEL